MKPTQSKKSLIVEVAVATIIILIISHILYRLRFIPFVDEYLSVLVAIQLLYLPIAILWKLRREIDFLDRSAKMFLKSILIFLVAAAIVFPLFFMVAHLWQIHVIGFKGFHLASYPSMDVILYQLLIVALPEEFYFRGYVQSAMTRVFPARWQFLVARLGWGWIITAAIFAVAHTFIIYRWWHFAIFFPALVFGYLREKTGSITAPILFHAASNILMNWFSRSYF